LNERLDGLRALLRGFGRVAVAYSGGVDSTLVLKVAHDELGENAIGLTAVSASMPHYERGAADDVAQQIGARVLWIQTHEDQDDRYLENPPDRCYFCKTDVYDELIQAAAAEGFTVLLDGTNADDVGDWRPGRHAAREHGVRSPLQEAGFTKDDIRATARELGLSNWDLPSAPCLSSRVPYGTRITPDMLDQIGKGEWALRERGFREVRVRHHGNVARIEVPVGDLERVLQMRDEIVAELKAAGYTYVALDLSGLKSGNLNLALTSSRSTSGRREATPPAE
jgi:pyridinium-3,5-biscarboxylic acid mononucleotide sulfurtransferase